MDGPLSEPDMGVQVVFGSDVIFFRLAVIVINCKQQSHLHTKVLIFTSVFLTYLRKYNCPTKYKKTKLITDPNILKSKCRKILIFEPAPHKLKKLSSCLFTFLPFPSCCELLFMYCIS